jgi:hypothetical protein
LVEVLGPARPHWAKHDRDNSKGWMMDVFYIGLALGFFALSWVFIVVCERLA